MRTLRSSAFSFRDEQVEQVARSPSPSHRRTLLSVRACVRPRQCVRGSPLSRRARVAAVVGSASLLYPLASSRQTHTHTQPSPLRTMEPRCVPAWTSSDKRKRRLPQASAAARSTQQAHCSLHTRAASVPLHLLLLLLAVFASLTAHCDALVQQAQVIARCRAWVNGSCEFAPLEPITFAALDLEQQTLCHVRQSLTLACLRSQRLLARRSHARVCRQTSRPQ